MNLLVLIIEASLHNKTAANSVSIHAAGNTMEADDFTKDVVPAISKLFASTDRSIRRSLLENIDTYGKSLTEVGPTAAERLPHPPPACPPQGLARVKLYGW